MQERPDLFNEIQPSVIEVKGAKFGPASESYCNAKRIITARHQLSELNESLVLEYARARKIEEATVGLSLQCSMPVFDVERALANTEMRWFWPRPTSNYSATILVGSGRQSGWRVGVAAR